MDKKKIILKGRPRSHSLSTGPFTDVDLTYENEKPFVMAKNISKIEGLYSLLTTRIGSLEEDIKRLTLKCNSMEEKIIQMGIEKKGMNIQNKKEVIIEEKNIHNDENVHSIFYPFIPKIL